MNFEVFWKNELNRNTCTNPTNCKWLACMLLSLVFPCACSTLPPGGKGFVLWTCATMCGRDRTRNQGNQCRVHPPGILGGCASLSIVSRAYIPVCRATMRAMIPCPLQVSQYHRRNANNISRALLPLSNGQSIPRTNWQSIGKDSCRLERRSMMLPPIHLWLGRLRNSELEYPCWYLNQWFHQATPKGDHLLSFALPHLSTLHGW